MMAMSIKEFAGEKEKSAESGVRAAARLLLDCVVRASAGALRADLLRRVWLQWGLLVPLAAGSLEPSCLRVAVGPAWWSVAVSVFGCGLVVFGSGDGRVLEDAARPGGVLAD
jgi:hypothetical protein